MSEFSHRHRTPDFEEWHADVADQLTQRIAVSVGDPVLGRELAAEAFARAYDKWPRVAKMDSPSGWVYRTAVNLSRRAWRRRAIERRALAKLNSGLTDLVLEPHEEWVEIGGHHPEDLTDLIDQLPERMQTAIRLRYWDGLTEAEVAHHMNTSTGAASATLSSARRHLEAKLREQR